MRSFLLPSVLLAAAAADHADDVVNSLNEQFNNGHPSDDLKEAGVLMHQWDNLGATDLNQIWRPYTPEECTPQAKHANCQYADRISCLLINNQVRSPGDNHIPLFSYGSGGVIEDPDETQITCSYSEDGGTMDRSNAGCGCHNGDTKCESLGDNNSCAKEGALADLDVCWWGPSDLSDMMKNQDGVYNEVVISSATYLSNLPKSPMAFFFIVNSSQSEIETRSAYASFQSSYPDSDVPLLVIDYTAEKSPFFKATNDQMYTTLQPGASTTSPSNSATSSSQKTGGSSTASPAAATTEGPSSGARSSAVVGSIIAASALALFVTL